MATILIVDDSPHWLSFMVDVFEGKYKVLQATNPSSAIEILRGDESVDLLLTDGDMDDISDAGVGLAKSAREIRGPGLPVILNSAAAMAPTIKAFYEEGLNSVGGGLVLSKGTPIDDYQNAVDVLIGSGRNNASLRRENPKKSATP